MRWGIAFRLPARERLKLDNWPEPSSIRRFGTLHGLSENITVSYCFMYGPRSWKEVQRIAAIKTQMQKRLPGLEFADMDEEDTITGRLWTVSELGGHFNEFVKFPKPFFPTTKKEAYMVLCLHAKRLHYEGLLHPEQLIATAIRFNNALGQPLGPRQVFKQAKAAYLFAEQHKEGWKVKLSLNELEVAHSRGGMKRGEQLKAEAVQRQERVRELLPTCTKPNGRPDMQKLMEQTGLSRRTVYNILKKV